MNKRILIIMVLICCRLYSQTIAPNNVRTTGGLEGTYFWDGSNARHYVPKNANTTTIFAAGICIGGYDQLGNLHLSAQTYRQNGSDFMTGNGVDSIPSLFDNAYNSTVTQNQINLFLQDRLDGVLNNVHTNIMQWPAKGNTVSGEYINEEYAPFVDINANGLYEPLMGEYPKIKGTEMMFSTYNDYKANDRKWDGLPLGFNFYSSIFGFDCSNDTVIDNTIFLELIIENNSENDYDSLHLGMFVDADLGNYTDDYVGSIPERNAFYFYNADANDEVTQSGYGTNIPVQSIAYLNKNMSTFLYYIGINNNPQSIPADANHFYNYLTGTWGDGRPWEWGGDGYNEGTYPTKYFWPSSPNLTGSNVWSECSEANVSDDRRGVGAVRIHRLAPNQRDTVRIAFITHWGIQYPCPDINSTPNSKVSREIAHIQALSQNNFASLVCTERKYISGNVYNDRNENCILDSIDYVKPCNVTVSSANYTETLQLNNNGTFSFLVPDNNVYTLTIDSTVLQASPSCGASFNQTIPVQGNNVDVNIPYNCSHDSVDLKINSLTIANFSYIKAVRVGLLNNTSCLNEDFYVTVALDPLMQYQPGGSVPFAIIQNHIVFKNPTTNISVQYHIDSSFISDSLCVEAYIDTLSTDPFANNNYIKRCRYISNFMKLITGKVAFDTQANCIVDSLERIAPIYKIEIRDTNNVYLSQAHFYNHQPNYMLRLDYSAPKMNIVYQNLAPDNYSVCNDSIYLNQSTISNINFSLDNNCDSPYINNTLHFASLNLIRNGSSSISFSALRNSDCITNANDIQIKISPNLPVNFLQISTNYNTISYISGNDYIINIPNFNSIYTAQLTVYFNHNLMMGDSLCFDIEIIQEANEANYDDNYKTICGIVRNSYDPNEKQCTSNTMSNNGNFYEIEPLYYDIHFQNLGNDTAYNVTIIDTLDTDLDIESIKILSASHPCIIRVNERIVFIEFNNINLDWASRNDIASKGYISYSIQPKSTIPYHTFIHNNASIYFDNNLPIVTNTTENQYMPYPLGIHHVNNSTNYFTISPNPVRDWLSIKPTAHTPYRMQLKIVNSLGMLIDIIDMKSFATQQYNTHKLASGVYFIQYAHGGNMQYAKFVKQE